MSIDRTSTIKPEVLDLLNTIRNKNTSTNINNFDNIENLFSNLTKNMDIETINNSQKQELKDKIDMYIKNCDCKINFYETFKKKMTDYIEVIDGHKTLNEEKLLIVIRIKNFKTLLNPNVKFCESTLIDRKNNITEITIDINEVLPQNIKIINEQQREIYLSILNIYHQPENYIVEFSVCKRENILVVSSHKIRKTS